MKAAIVYSNDEQAFSLDNQDTVVQMEEIYNQLFRLGIDTRSIAFNGSFCTLEHELNQIKPDFIFNLVETVNGTDRLSYTAAAFFDFLNIPYSGCSATILSTLSSKIRQKKLLRLAGLPTADFITDKFQHLQSVDGPWIVKSDTEHASVGINADSVVETTLDAKKKIHEKQNSFGGNWFAERYIDGREFNLSLLGRKDGSLQVLPPAEILFIDYPEKTPKIVDYAAKWETDSFSFGATQRRQDFSEGDRALLAQLEDLCRQCWDLFDLNGAVRVDFRVDMQGNPWILEINANPCLTSNAGFMAAAQKVLSTKEVIKRLLPISIPE